MIHQRTPAVAEAVVTALTQKEQFTGGRVGELRDAFWRRHLR